MRIKDKVWVVTGAGSGMGREIATQIAWKGGNLALVDLNAERLAEVMNQLEQFNVKVSTHVVNIAHRDAVEALAPQVLQVHGQVDGLINNAGIIQPFVRVADLDMDHIDRVMNVNFFGTLNMTKLFLPYLLKRPVAHIANVSSMGGFLPVPGQTIYGASKAAVKLFTEGLYAELLDTDVNVSVIFPGAVATNITENSGVDIPHVDSKSSAKPLPASKAAEIILKGISKDRYHIMVGSDALFLHRFSRLAPKRAAKFIAKKMKNLLS